MRARTPLLLLASTACTSLPFGTCPERWDTLQPVESRFLHQDGEHIVGPSGEPELLRAVNLGGWLHWEAWMFGGELEITDLKQGSEGQVLARITELYGEETAAWFQQRIREAFITEADFAAIAELGFDLVRLPINHTLLDDEAGWAFLDAALAMAEAHELRVVIDMHAAPGGQADIFTADPDDTLLWEEQTFQDGLVGDWAAIAGRYADRGVIAGYDLLNEPDPPEPGDLLDLYARILEVVRAADSEHLVFIEGAALSRDFTIFEQRLDPNMAYSPHVYLWAGWPDQRWIASLQELSECHRTPVWVGEFGEDRYGDLQGLREGFETMAGWAVWSWKKVDVGGTPGITTFEAPQAWHELMASLTDEPGSEAVMSDTAAREALEAFLAAATEPSLDQEMVEALGL